MFQLIWPSTVLYFCSISMIEVSASRLSCTGVTETSVYSLEEAKRVNYHFPLRNEACTARWHIKGYKTCPIALKCYSKLPQDTGLCSEFVHFQVLDKYGGKYFPCGEEMFTVRPNGRELFVAIETKRGYTRGGYVNCLLLCDLKNEFERLSMPISNENHAYHLAHEISPASRAVVFEWPSGESKDIGFWSVFGTNNCSVGLSCSAKMNLDCNETEAYVKVSDGTNGEKMFCGNMSFHVRTSDSRLRDMFLKVNDPNDVKRINLYCWSQCIYDKIEHYYQQLPQTLGRRTDMRCVCGLHNKDDRIVGGQFATMNEFPWHVALVRKNSRIEFCGGTVINDRFVLTAKHCIVSPDNFADKTEVLIHAHMLEQATPPGIPEFEVNKNFDELYNFPIHASVLEADEKENTQRMKIAEIILPALKYNNIKFDYDIALLRLDKKIDLGQPDGPTPICLPPADQHAEYSNRLIDEVLTVTGWGITETGKQSHTLKKANVPYVPNDECDAAYKKKTGVSNKLTPRMMCAFVKDENSVNDGMCFGDSGGALSFKNEMNQAVQVGVNSYAVGGCPANGTIAVYAKISEMVQWIAFHANEWNAKWCRNMNEY